MWHTIHNLGILREIDKNRSHLICAILHYNNKEDERAYFTNTLGVCDVRSKQP